MKKVFKYLIILCFVLIFMIGCNHQHSYQEEIINPTCDSSGYTKYTCKCGDTFIEDEVNSLGHNFNVWEVVIEATEETNGLEERICIVCNYKESRIIDKLNHVHNYIEEIYIPTCTEKGYTKHICKCGESYNDNEVEALGHNEVIDQEKTPTCTETGLTEGKHCSRCNEVLVNQELIEALGHLEVIDIKIDATCTETGLTEGKHCSRCNEVLIKQTIIEALDHNIVIDAEKEPTCTETGLTEGKYCSRCNEVLVPQEVIDSIGHIYGEWEIIIEATEEYEGQKERKCNKCDDKEIEKISKINHIHNYVKEIYNPTCLDIGYTKYTCRCGDTYNDNQIEALGHLEIIDNSVEATCTTTGLTEGKHCGRCNEILLVQEKINALGHDYGPWEVITEATEESEGLKEKTCKYCQDKETKIINKLEHIHIYVEEIINPTCIDKGYTIYTCRCGDSYTENYVDIIEHIYQDYQCINCGIKKASEGLEYDRGAYGEVLFRSLGTCTDKKIIIPHFNGVLLIFSNIFVNLNDVEEIDFMNYEDKLEIQNDAFSGCTSLKTLILPKNVQKIGNNVFYNTTIENVYYNGTLADFVGIEFIGENSNPLYCVDNVYFKNENDEFYLYHVHRYQEEIINPTCLEKGYSIYTCRCGDSYRGNEVAALGHIYDWNISIEPTVEINGLEVGICSGCDKKIDNEITIYDTYLKYELVNKEYYEVVGYNSDKFTGGEIKISESFRGLPVKSIKSEAFKDCNTLESITIPYQISEIGENTFFECRMLKNTYYTGTIENWCNLKFNGLSSNPMSYARYLYLLDENNEFNVVKEIEIPDTFTSIQDYQFYGIWTLEVVRFSSNVKSFGHAAFTQCVRIKDVYFDGTIEEWFDIECNGQDSMPTNYVQNIYLLNDNNEYQEVTEIEIPQNISSIGDYKLSRFGKLNNVIIPDNITRIGIEAFRECYSLTDITISSSVKAIDVNAFVNCNNLKRIYFNGTIDEWNNITFGNEYSNPMYYGKHLYVLNQDNEYVLMSDHIVVIDKRIEPTCSTTGLTEGSHCQICNEIIVQQEVIEMVEHIYDAWIVVKDATDEEEGLREKSCKECGYKVSEVISKLDHIHIYVEEIINPTCIDKGYTIYTCRCGDSYTENYVDIIEHIYQDYQCINCGIKKASEGLEYDRGAYGEVLFRSLGTCTDKKIIIPHFNGVLLIFSNIFVNLNDVEEIDFMNYEDKLEIQNDAFSGCTSLKTLILPKNVQKIGNNVFYNTTIENVYYNGTLADFVGIEFIGENSNPLYCVDNVYFKNENDEFYLYHVHRYQEEIINPTCLEKGYSIYTCRCGDSYRGNEIDALGHKYINKVCVNCNDELIPSEGLKYILSSDDTYLVSGIGTCNDTVIVIPDEYQGKVVSGIYDKAFMNCISIKEIHMGLNIKSIGASAFRACKKLEYISLSDNIERIGKTSFYECSVLRSIVLPSKLIGIEENTFNFCYSLEEITIPASVTYINCSFSNNSNDNMERVYYNGTIENWCNIILKASYSNPMNIGKYFYMLDDNKEYYEVKEIAIPNTISVINQYQFHGFDNLMKVTISSSVKEICIYAFGNCTSLDNVLFEDGIISIGNYVFKNCTSLLSITIPSSVESIGEHAFEGCTALESVLLEEGISEIGIFAFSGCIALESIVIPQTISTINESLFRDCTSLKDIELSNKITIIKDYAFLGCTALERIIIPEAVTSIGSSAFSGCTSLENVFIPKSVTSIGSSAFSGCTSLENIIIPEGVTSIGSSAFFECSSLKKIILPEKIKTINSKTFGKCTALESIMLPEGITSIGDSAFYNCPNLTDLVLPDSVTSMGKYVLEGCNSLEKINIPTSMTSIAMYTFAYFRGLKEIVIPANIVTVGQEAFIYCTNLKTIVFERGVKNINTRAFQYCSSLEKVIIPNSVTNIKNYVFRDCGEATVYCEYESKPSGFGAYWDYRTATRDQKVVWGYVI